MTANYRATTNDCDNMPFRERCVGRHPAANGTADYRSAYAMRLDDACIYHLPTINGHMPADLDDA